MSRIARIETFRVPPRWLFVRVETHDGAAAALAPNFVIQEMSLGIHYNTREHDLLTYLKKPDVFRVRDGMVEVLEGKGLGVEIDEARVREAARTPHEWYNPVWRGPDGSLREW